MIFVGFRRAPQLVAFDLECVDENEARPSLSWAVPSDEQVLALAPFEHQRKMIIGTSKGGIHVVDCQSSTLVRLISQGNNPLAFGAAVPFVGTSQAFGITSLATVGLAGSPFICAGTKGGAVRLYDARWGKSCVSMYAPSSGSEVCSFVQLESDPFSLWANFFDGTIRKLSLPKLMNSCSLHRMDAEEEVHLRDGARSSANAVFERPKMIAMQFSGLIMCPHVGTNSITVINTLEGFDAPQEAVQCPERNHKAFTKRAALSHFSSLPNGQATLDRCTMTSLCFGSDSPAITSIVATQMLQAVVVGDVTGRLEVSRW